mmetsp:Transcript_8447/g.12682  ORF Transcript_8447/g.12682 Transcript_8447/m.12682 type:complete len:150 (+) Transcript_8447:71-520(+)
MADPIFFINQPNPYGLPAFNLSLNITEEDVLQELERLKDIKKAEEERYKKLHPPGVNTTKSRRFPEKVIEDVMSDPDEKNFKSEEEKKNYIEKRKIWRQMVERGLVYSYPPTKLYTHSGEVPRRRRPRSIAVPFHFVPDKEPEPSPKLL